MMEEIVPSGGPKGPCLVGHSFQLGTSSEVDVVVASPTTVRVTKWLDLDVVRVRVWDGVMVCGERVSGWEGAVKGVDVVFGGGIESVEECWELERDEDEIENGRSEDEVVELPSSINSSNC